MRRHFGVVHSIGIIQQGKVRDRVVLQQDHA